MSELTTWIIGGLVSASFIAMGVFLVRKEKWRD